MEYRDIADRLAEIVTEHLSGGEKVDDFQKPLEDYGIDSLDEADIILAINGEWGLELEGVGEERTVEGIARLIHRTLETAQGE